MYSPGWQGHTPVGESTSNAVHPGRIGKRDVGGTYAPQFDSGLQMPGIVANGEGITQATPTRLPFPTHTQSASEVLPALGVVDQRGHAEHSPTLP